jgi:hypothetical protein
MGLMPSNVRWHVAEQSGQQRIELMRLFTGSIVLGLMMYIQALEGTQRWRRDSDTASRPEVHGVWKEFDGFSLCKNRQERMQRILDGGSAKRTAAAVVPENNQCNAK